MFPHFHQQLVTTQTHQCESQLHNAVLIIEPETELVALHDKKTKKKKQINAIQLRWD